MPARPARSPHPPVVDAAAAGDLPLEVRISARARRMTMQVDPATRMVRVVAPQHVSPTQISRFITRHADWARVRLAALPPPQPLADGALVPYLGVQHRVRHVAGAGRPVWREDGMLHVGGRPEHVPRRLHDFLVAEARRELTRRAHAKAVQLGVRVAGVTVRDTRTRWGSCSTQGRLNFSWRLILAPETVLDYVVAHEVAHLVEMNHSRRFWALVGQLCPDVAGPRAWLKANGTQLHRFG